MWGILSDRLHTRIWIALAITAVNVVSNAVLAASVSKATIFLGYMINAATYAYGPIIIVKTPTTTHIGDIETVTDMPFYSHI